MALFECDVFECKEPAVAAYTIEWPNSLNLPTTARSCMEHQSYVELGIWAGYGGRGQRPVSIERQLILIPPD